MRRGMITGVVVVGIGITVAALVSVGITAVRTGDSAVSVGISEGA